MDHNSQSYPSATTRQQTTAAMKSDPNASLLLDSQALSTSQQSHATRKSDGSTVQMTIGTSNSTNDNFNVSVTPAIHGPDTGLSGGVIAVVVVLIAVGAALMSLLVYLKITNKLHRFVPCKVKVTKRRSSTTSSRRPLDPDDLEEEGRREDDLPATREVTMFTIDDFEPVQNDEYGRSGEQEEYYYDEVFGQSMFEDEVTNTSMRHLCLVTENDEDDMFEVDVGSLHPDGPPTPTTTTTTTTTNNNNNNSSSSNSRSFPTSARKT